MNNVAQDSEKTWHRQFWPWFLIALPGIVIIASISTAIIAFRTSDSLVQENPYRAGLAVNDSLELDKKASELKLRAKISLDSENGEVRVALKNSPDNLQPLTLELLHAKEKSKDIQLLLQATPQGDWLGHLPNTLIGQWYIRLSNKNSSNKKSAETQNNVAEWRLQNSILLGAADKASSNIEIIIIDAE